MTAAECISGAVSTGENATRVRYIVGSLKVFGIDYCLGGVNYPFARIVAKKNLMFVMNCFLCKIEG